jgi:hypothetical protein
MCNMSEFDVLGLLASNLTGARSQASLSEYTVFQNITDSANGALAHGVNQVRSVANTFSKELLASAAGPTIKLPRTHFDWFQSIVPQLVENDLAIVQEFIGATRSDRSIRGAELDAEPVPRTFTDFTSLLTSSRQFVDALVTDAYQLTMLDPKVTNFFILSSLSSFGRLATPSLRSTVMGQTLHPVLHVFDSLSYVKRLRSDFTSCPHPKFGQKLDFLIAKYFSNDQSRFKERVKDLYAFASDFTHVGYVSTFFSTTASSMLYMKDTFDTTYLVSGANYCEIKFEILDLALELFCKVYLSSFLHTIEQMADSESVTKHSNALHEIVATIDKRMKPIARLYRYFIGSSTIASTVAFAVPCPYGAILTWRLPENLPSICASCGSVFYAIVVDGDPGYLSGALTPVRVVGSTQPVDARWPTTYFLVDERIRMRPTLQAREQT